MRITGHVVKEFDAVERSQEVLVLLHGGAGPGEPVQQRAWQGTEGVAGVRGQRSSQHIPAGEQSSAQQGKTRAHSRALHVPCRLSGVEHGAFAAFLAQLPYTGPFLGLGAEALNGGAAFRPAAMRLFSGAHGTVWYTPTLVCNARGTTSLVW